MTHRRGMRRKPGGNRKEKEKKAKERGGELERDREANLHHVKQDQSKMVKSAMPPRLKAVNIHEERTDGWENAERGVAASACHLREME